MSELISVIIPIYNVEKYINETVESVKKQDYKNIEIILVDDGSPDNCGIIIDSLAKTDDRIICIHKNNGGVSSARNAGLSIAKGEYVTFIDGDDWVDCDYVSYLFELVKSQECLVGMNKNNYSDSNHKSSNAMYYVQAEKAIEWIYLNEIFVAVWNKIYNMKFLRDNSIIFDESIWYGEGMLFNVDCLQFVNRVAIGEKCVYHQVTNPNSAMRRFNVESNLCGIKSLEIQREHWRKNNTAIDNAWKYHRRAFNLTIAVGLARCDMEDDYPDLYQECIKNIKSDLYTTLRVKISLKEKLLNVCFSIAPKLMLKRVKKKSGWRS
ncbi:MAG: glycosyltransferase family 2 protein [Erysipelotrichaceae bacterium]|nr:glycosyltransferase family 2 protein [Erysipelotrichaceae bacterium]